MKQLQLFRLPAVLVVSVGSVLTLSAGFGDDVGSSNQKNDGVTRQAAPKSAADDTPPNAKDDDSATPKPPAKDPLEEWKELSRRKLEIARKLKTLRADFYKSGVDDKRKKEIQSEFSELLAEYRLEIENRMDRLAAAVYEKQPDNIEAAELLMENEYKANRFQRALEVAEAALKTGKKTKYDAKMAINIAGAASFALNQFEQAEKYFEQAQEKSQLDSQYGGRYRPHTADYIKFWKKEQEIRAAEAKAEGEEILPRVELTINRGDDELGTIVIELFENEAPNTVANFISIVEHKEKNYNDVKFHRVIPNFMAQTGNLKDADKGDLGYTIECECYAKNARKHFRGSVSMALKGKDTGDSQFFITHLPTYWLNEEVDPDSVHTVFGRVVEDAGDGMEVVDKIQVGDVIAGAKVLRKRNHAYKPETTPNLGS